MMKLSYILALCLCLLAIHTSAQSSEEGAAQQVVALGLSNALEIGFTATNSNTGNTVTLSFSTANHYANGVTSSNQGMRVRSNKNFNVTVKAAASTFSVTNNGNTATSTMPASVLRLRVRWDPDFPAIRH
jgi:hypothetical protein